MHSRVEQRYVCHRCGRTGAATTGTPCYRLRLAPEWVTVVLTLRSHGCPPQAIVAAWDLAERTVADWLARAGTHGAGVPEHRVRQGRVDWPHVQADERWVKLVGRRVWLALALAAPSRLWLGGALSPQRDRVLITGLVPPVRAGAGRLAILVWVDGLASSVTACLRGFRTPVYTGRRGRPRRVLRAGGLLGRVVKPYAQRRVVGVQQRVGHGTAAAIATVLAAPGTGRGIHTASMERLHATFRSCLAPLVRRGRAIAHQVETLPAGRYLVGTAYHCCWEHASRRVAAPAGARPKGQAHTPALAAGLTDPCWTRQELFRYPVPLPASVAPQRRGRPPKPARSPAPAVAA